MEKRDGAAPSRIRGNRLLSGLYIDVDDLQRIEDLIHREQMKHGLLNVPTWAKNKSEVIRAAIKYFLEHVKA
jgi:hypothetical protein